MEYRNYIIKTYLDIRQACYETEAGDTPVWRALVGALNLVQNELVKHDITHEEIEAMKVG